MIATRFHKVSAIICTRNRAASLERTLQTMVKLDLEGIAEFELVVVDNGSSDATSSIIESFKADAPFPVHYVSELRPGLSAARNSGLALASGALILFTDDDCLVPANWAQVGVGLLELEPLQVIGGRVDLHNPAHLQVSIRTGLAGKTASPVEVFGFVIGANMGFGRAVVDKIGLFDVRLGAGTPLHAAEDTEFAYRALINGIPVRYDPSLVVRHDHGRTEQSDFYRIIRGYAVGGGAIMMRYLLTGRIDLARAIYWDLLAALRRRDETGWRSPLLKLAFLNGAVRFLLQSSWRRAW